MLVRLRLCCCRAPLSLLRRLALASWSAGFAAVIPSGLVPATMAPSLAYSSAAWISALDGMQPMLRQVPPGFAFSTITVSTPSCPARMAHT